MTDDGLTFGADLDELARLLVGSALRAASARFSEITERDRIMVGLGVHLALGIVAESAPEILRQSATWRIPIPADAEGGGQ